MGRWVFGGMVAALCFLSAPSAATCSSCPDKECSTQCSRGCSCVKGPGQRRGSCWNVQDVPELEAAGWEVLP